MRPRGAAAFGGHNALTFFLKKNSVNRRIG
jgi:hypothetical protein